MSELVQLNYHFRMARAKRWDAQQAWHWLEPSPSPVRKVHNRGLGQGLLSRPLKIFHNLSSRLRFSFSSLRFVAVPAHLLPSCHVKVSLMKMNEFLLNQRRLITRGMHFSTRIGSSMLSESVFLQGITVIYLVKVRAPSSTNPWIVGFISIRLWKILNDSDK